MRFAQIGLLACIAGVGLDTVALAESYSTYASVATHATAISDTVGQKVDFAQSDFDDGIGDPASAAAGSVAVGHLTAVGSSDGEARADFGDLSLAVNTLAIGTGVAAHFDDPASLGGGYAYAKSEAKWLDRIVLNVPLLSPGHSIKLNAIFNIAGNIGAMANLQPAIPDMHPSYPKQGSTADIYLSLMLTNSNGSVDPLDGCYLGSLCGERDIEPGVDLDLDLPVPRFVKTAFTVPNGVGTHVSFNATLAAEVAASQTTEASAVGIIRNSIHWGGIESVTDADTGEVYEDWTITSDSGFDYSKPFVPEPSALVLLATAAIAWIIHKR